MKRILGDKMLTTRQNLLPLSEKATFLAVFRYSVELYILVRGDPDEVRFFTTTLALIQSSLGSQLWLLLSISSSFLI